MLSSRALAQVQNGQMTHDEGTRGLDLTAADDWRNELEFRRVFWTQEIEVTALIALQDMIDVKPGVATKVGALVWALPRESARKVVCGNQRVQTALRHIQPDQIATSDNGNRSTCSCLGTGVQNHGPIAGAAHPRIADANHVVHPGRLELARNRNSTPLRHTRYSLGPTILQDQNRVSRYIQIGVVDARQHVAIVFKNHRYALMLQQTRRCCRRLQDGPPWHQVAMQHRDRTLLLQRIRERPDHIGIMGDNVAKVLADRLASYRPATRVEERLDFFHYGGDTPCGMKGVN